MYPYRPDAATGDPQVRLAEARREAAERWARDASDPGERSPARERRVGGIALVILGALALVALVLIPLLRI